MSADFTLRYGDTLKVHTGQLTKSVASTEKYTPPNGATLKMVLKKVGGTRVELACELGTDGTWTRRWVSADFSALFQQAPTSTTSFTMYFEVTDQSGGKLTFPDEVSKETYQVDVFAPL